MREYRRYNFCVPESVLNKQNVVESKIQLATVVDSFTNSYNIFAQCFKSAEVKVAYSAYLPVLKKPKTMQF